MSYYKPMADYDVPRDVARMDNRGVGAGFMKKIT